jgi:hypothetical protein
MLIINGLIAHKPRSYVRAARAFQHDVPAGHDMCFSYSADFGFGFGSNFNTDPAVSQGGLAPCTTPPLFHSV